MKLMTGLKRYFQGHTASYLPETAEKVGPVGETKQPDLTERLATSATGWAAIIDDVLDARTISDSKNMCALYALRCCGFGVMNPCGDTDCDCNVKILTGMAPKVKLVQVRIEVMDDA